MPTPAQVVGTRIRTFRRTHQLTQKAFARGVHVGQSAVSQWESGRKIPAVPTQYVIADFFKVPRSSLFAEVIRDEAA